MGKKESELGMPNGQILRGSLVNGVINGAINGGVQLYFLWDETSIPLTVDAITNDEKTVLGSAVPLAMSLAIILTVIAYFTLTVPKRDFFPTVAWLTIKHGVFSFGLIVAGAVVWQKAVGTITVSLAGAVTVLAITAGIVAGIVNYMTIRASVLEKS